MEERREVIPLFVFLALATAASFLRTIAGRDWSDL
jgi:hypothetical protein